MEILLVFLCCGSLLFTTAFGVGLTFLLERFLGIWAYVAGALVPVVVFTALYTLYHIYVRATACEPQGSLACGEPFFTAFFLFVGVAFFLLIANILAQTSLYLFLFGRGRAIPAAVYENVGEPAGAEMQNEMGAPIAAAQMSAEPYDETPAPDQFAQEFAQEQPPDENQWSGLPPDLPEEEPPASA